MSGASGFPTLAPRQRPGCVVSFDEAAGRWLVLQPAAVAGMLTWCVLDAALTQAAAEHAAGLHASPAVHWLLRDPALEAWRRSFGHGWMSEPTPACRFTREAAERILREEPGLELRVIRADGTLTCPDLPA